MLAYLVSYLDRVNIGYAKLQMLSALQFSDAVYGLGAGIFFVGYFLCEVPSNLLLEKIGARKTMLRIMVLWGAVAAGMMAVKTPTQFYFMRFLLGMFEAGFFPGVALFLHLDDKPDQARWLNVVERELLRADMAVGWSDKARPKVSVWAMLKSQVVYGYAMINFLMIGATYALLFWVPSLVGMCIATVGVASTTPLFITAATEALPRYLSAALLLAVSRRRD
ncbi:MFS transporter [Duganella sp. FT135W]|uniref:MFS transporter n=2 Tax=Duganella flavida TaxID=2692175 RepID=A0A6L8K9F2_9BURK|nr:MFS transporter [Duganella flavida]